MTRDVHPNEKKPTVIVRAIVMERQQNSEGQNGGLPSRRSILRMPHDLQAHSVEVRIRSCAIPDAIGDWISPRLYGSELRALETCGSHGSYFANGRSKTF